MIEFSLLGSGSSGNALFVKSDGGKILIDNGLSFKKLSERVHQAGETLDGLQAVFITHEHGDHVNGLGVLSRKMPVPIYVTPSTFNELPSGVGRLENIRHFESGERVHLDPFTITSFRVAHDAADPVSYVVECDGCKLGIATDLGSSSNLVRQRLQNCHALILESNYCHEMIRNSPYPAQIVQRIRSNHGHLSNADMNKLLDDLLHDDLRLVVAVHVSQENNSVDKVRSMTERVLKGHRAELYIADQDKPTPMLNIMEHGMADTVERAS